ncbi:hypothetical protein KIL84_008377, partial [Mauremys mutica]
MTQTLFRDTRTTSWHLGPCNWVLGMALPGQSCPWVYQGIPRKAAGWVNSAVSWFFSQSGDISRLQTLEDVCPLDRLFPDGEKTNADTTKKEPVLIGKSIASH